MLRIFDQSPRRNHLHIAQKGGHVPTVDNGVNASRAAFSLGGAAVYAAYFEGGMGYRNDNTSGVAVGREEETLYMVTSGQHFNAGCAACTTESTLCALLSFAQRRPPDDAFRCAQAASITGTLRRTIMTTAPGRWRRCTGAGVDSDSAPCSPGLLTR